MVGTILINLKSFCECNFLVNLNLVSSIFGAYIPTDAVHKIDKYSVFDNIPPFAVKRLIK